MKKFFQNNKIFWLGIVSLSLLGLLFLGAGTVFADEGTQCTVGTQKGICKGAGCSAFGEVDLKAPVADLSTTCAIPSATNLKCCATACSGTRLGNTESVNGICQISCTVAADLLNQGASSTCTALAAPACCALTTTDDSVCKSDADSTVTGTCQLDPCTSDTDKIADASDCAAPKNCCKASVVPPNIQFDTCSPNGKCSPTTAACPTDNPRDITDLINPGSYECSGDTAKCCAPAATPAEDATPGTTTNPPSTIPEEASAFAKVLSWFISLIIKLAGALLLAVVELIVKVSQFNRIINSYFVVQAWIILRDLVNMFFVLGLLFIAFVTVLKIEKYQWQKLLPKLLIMAVVVNFSRTICGVIIDFFQVMMFTFINAYKDIAGENVFKGLGARDMWDQVGGNVPGAEYGDMALITGRLLGLIYIIIALIVMVIFLVILVFRIVALWVLVVFSPLAFFSYAFQGMSGKIGGYWTKWFNMFIEYCMVGPLLAFFLWISILSMGSDYNAQYAKEMSAVSTGSQGQTELLRASSAPAGVTSNKAGQLDYVMKYVLGIIMLVAGLKFTSEMKVVGASAAGKAASKIQDTAYKTASRVARSPLYAAGLGLAGAAAVGKFGYGQYVQPRLQGTAEGISKAWQTKEGYRDFGKKMLEGTRNRLGASEAPTLRKLGQILGGTPAELPENLGKSRRMPVIGDLAAFGKAFWNETALTKGQREYIKKRTKASADANLSKDFKPLREIDAARAKEIGKMLPFDLTDRIQVQENFDNFLKQNAGKKLDINGQRIVEVLFGAESDLSLANEARADQLEDVGFMEDSSRLERIILQKEMEERQKKARGWSNSLSGDILNPDTNEQENYRDVQEGLAGAIKDLSAKTGMSRAEVRSLLGTFDFDKLTAKDASGQYFFKADEFAKEVASRTGDEKKLLEKIGDMEQQPGQENLFMGVARSTEFNKKRQKEIKSNIRSAGGDKVVNLLNDAHFGDFIYHGVENMDSVMQGAAEQKQFVAKASAPIRERDATILDFTNSGDNELRIKMLNEKPEQLASWIQSLEKKLNKKIADVTKADLDNMPEFKAWDAKLDKRVIKDETARYKFSSALRSTYDADNRLDQFRPASPVMQKNMDKATAREGVDVKIDTAVSTLPGLTGSNLTAVATEVKNRIDSLINSSDDQDVRIGAIADLLTSQLATIPGAFYTADQINALAANLESNADAIKKRIKAADEGSAQAVKRIKSFQNMFDAILSSGKPITDEDKEIFAIQANALVEGVKKFAKNNALGNRYDTDTLRSRLMQAINASEPDQIDISKFKSQMDVLQAELKNAIAANDNRGRKNAREKINELEKKWKSIFSDIDDVLK